MLKYIQLQNGERLLAGWEPDEPLFSRLHKGLEAIWQSVWLELNFRGKAQVTENLESFGEFYG